MWSIQQSCVVSKVISISSIGKEKFQPLTKDIAESPINQRINLILSRTTFDRNIFLFHFLVFHYGSHNLNMICLMLIWFIIHPDTIDSSHHQSFSHWSLNCHSIRWFYQLPFSNLQNVWHQRNAVDQIRSEYDQLSSFPTTVMGKSASPAKLSQHLEYLASSATTTYAVQHLAKSPSPTNALL